MDKLLNDINMKRIVIMFGTNYTHQEFGLNKQKVSIFLLLLSNLRHLGRGVIEIVNDAARNIYPGY